MTFSTMNSTKIIDYSETPNSSETNSNTSTDKCCHAKRFSIIIIACRVIMSSFAVAAAAAIQLSTDIVLPDLNLSFNNKEEAITLHCIVGLLGIFNFVQCCLLFRLLTKLFWSIGYKRAYFLTLSYWLVTCLSVIFLKLFDGY